MKMRMPAGPDWLLLGRTLGVSPVPMGMPEVYLALKTGAIDGLNLGSGGEYLYFRVTQSGAVPDRVWTAPVWAEGGRTNPTP